MEVVNFNDENGNREKFINTKVFVIDKNKLSILI